MLQNRQAWCKSQMRVVIFATVLTFVFGLPCPTQGQTLCGWIGVQVSPMTQAFAESLGMTELYGAIFDQPEPDSPAAHEHIEKGDVLTTINGSPLIQASDFAKIISAMAPGTTVHLYTWRDGQPRQVKLVLGSVHCRGEKS
jgi:serine protease Do